jgi:hypothetical protein
MKKAVLGTLVALPVVYYVAVVLRYMYNFPYMDDYPTVVDFLNRWPETDTLGQKVALLLEQNNFHRLVLVKLIALLNVGLTGEVDFRVLQVVGLGFLLLTAWLLWRTYAEAWQHEPLAVRQPLFTVAFLPVLFLLFQFQGWNIAFWGIVAVSNVGAPALALLTFWLAFRKHELWAIAVGVVALFTNGNGMLVLPLLVLAWAFQGHPARTTVALIVTVPALLFYFLDYQNPAGPSLAALLQPARFLHLLALDTAFLGALVYHPAVPWLPILLGTFTVGWMGYLVLIRYNCTNPTLFWLLVFLHLSGLMLAVNRLQNDTSIVFASRYRNITALHIAATYLTMLDGPLRLLVGDLKRWGHRQAELMLASLVALGTFGLGAVSNYTYHSKIERFRELKQTDNLLWAQFGQNRGCAPQYKPVEMLGIMAERRTFIPPAADQALGESTLGTLQSRPVAISPLTTAGDSLQYHIDIQQERQGFLIVSGWAKVAGRKANFNDTYVGLKTATGWQYYTTLFHQRLDNADSANDKDTGFTAIIPLAGKNAPRPDSVAIFVRSGRFKAQGFKVQGAGFKAQAYSSVGEVPAP